MAVKSFRVQAQRKEQLKMSASDKYFFSIFHSFQRMSIKNWNSNYDYVHGFYNRRCSWMTLGRIVHFCSADCWDSFLCSSALSHNDDCHSDKCQSEECRSVEWRYNGCHCSEYISNVCCSADCHSNEWHPDEYHFNEWHPDECHSNEWHPSESILMNAIWMNAILMNAIWMNAIWMNAILIMIAILTNANLMNTILICHSFYNTLGFSYFSSVTFVKLILYFQMEKNNYLKAIIFFCYFSLLCEKQ